jgi:anthranilate phosphoribosyltransferase
MSKIACFPEILSALIAGRDLTPPQVDAALTAIADGQASDAEAGAFLKALRSKGETAVELAAAVRVLRARMIGWDPGRPVLDTCGTGGDGACTFNISTAVAFVVAGAGVPVVKHGNRSVSGRSGSADLLAELGIQLHHEPAAAQRALDRCGLAFCFAPSFHPALKNVAELRRRLGIPTLFNWIGPLLNPAGAPYQLLGVGRLEMLNVLAECLAQLGSVRTLLVCSADGLDEVSLSAITYVRQVEGNKVTAWQWCATDFDLESCQLADLSVDGPVASAATVRKILAGEPGPASRVVLANAAAALLAAEKARSLAEGVALASQALASGAAQFVMDSLKMDG